MTEDELNIDVYYKVQAYAALYKASGEYVNQIPADEVTVTLVRDGYPEGMMELLKKQGAMIQERHPGVYEVCGTSLFPTQVIVTKRLSAENHAGLRVLTRHVRREDVENFLMAVQKIKNPGDLARIDAILQVSVTANKELYEQMYKEETEMCQALREIMAADFKKAEIRGEARGEARGIYITLAGLVKDQLITIAEAARRAGVTEEEFRQRAGLILRQ